MLRDPCSDMTRRRWGRHAAGLLAVAAGALLIAGGHAAIGWALIVAGLAFWAAPPW